MPIRQPTRPCTKAPLTFADQVARLASRGLGVGNIAEAERLLSRVSYYRLSAYWFPLKDDSNRFEPGATLAEANRLYEFDRRLRLLIMDAVERVEVAARTGIAYHFCHKYGPYGHEDPANFHRSFSADHLEWITRLHEEAERSKETFVVHYKNTYDGFPSLPLWVAAETMSLGSLSVMYEGLEAVDVNAICAPYGVPWKVLRSWLHALNYIRNVCAHHGRLWNKDLAIKPIFPTPFNWARPTAEERHWMHPLLPDKGKIYGVLLMLRYLLRHQEAGVNWSNKLRDLLAEMRPFPKWQKAMGVPENWQDHPFWS